MAIVLLTARLMLGDSRFLDDASQTGFVDRLLARVRALPTVEAAGVGSTLPPTDAPTTVSLRYRSDTRDDAIMQLNPTLPLPDVQTLDDHIAGSIAGRRLQLVPAAAVAALALAVAMVGLFGTLGRAVTERRQELSIRAAAAAGRALSSLLYGISPYDPVTFAVVTGLVLVAALIASIMPARRAARLDPLIALKGE